MFKLNRIKAPMQKIKWFEMQQIDYQFKLPLLIDRRGYVLLGNSVKEQHIHKEELDVVVISVDDYLKDVLYEIEKAVVKENKLERCIEIEKELSQYLREFNKDYELISLFDDEEIKEYRLITNENFIMPPPYNFKKNSNKNKDEEMDSDDLFRLMQKEKM